MSKIRAGVRWIGCGALWLGLSLLTACTTLPTDSLDGHPVPFDGEALAHCYQQEQAARRAGPPHWGVEGVLDLEASDHERRNRINLLGTRDEFIRMRAYGPFQQVALELLAGPDWMRWVDPQKQTVTQVPATSAGMMYLIGAPLEPARLFQVLMGWAGPLSDEEPVFSGTQDGIFATTREGERIRLDPTQGRLLERFGETVPGRAYHAVYTWSQSALEPNVDWVLPERILVTLESPPMRMEFIFKRWYFPLAGPPATLFDEEPLPGFTLILPLDGND